LTLALERCSAAPPGGRAPGFKEALPGPAALPAAGVVPAAGNVPASGVVPVSVPLLFTANEKNVFSEDLVQLLAKLAENISFALDNFDRADEKTKADERIEYLASHDSLTNLPNREMFNELLRHAIEAAYRHQRQFAVLFIDLDRFKVINDSLGHDAGDILLIEIAGRLRQSLRASDVVARLGGDEFVVILEETAERDDVERIARNVLSVLSQPSQLSGHECHTTASIGIAMYPSDGADVQTLTKNADIAMYQVKEAGGDQAAVYDGRSGALMSRVNSIREALAEQRFVLHAQPIVDLRTGRVAYHELLIRMISERGEIIPPGDFLPIAERFSLAGEIDSWVVGEALDLARHQPLTVNLSGRSIGDPRILSAITNAVGAGLDPRSLMIEITETAALSELENATAFALALVELGCDLALDDFGTGFGSFTYLKLVPARYLKIDVKFVRDINTDPTDKEIVRSIVGIARTLGKETIAEGVESPGVLQTLRELGVGYAQGFQLGRPEPLVPPPTAVTPGANGAQISRTRSGATSSGPRTSASC